MGYNSDWCPSGYGFTPSRIWDGGYPRLGIRSDGHSGGHITQGGILALGGPLKKGLWTRGENGGGKPQGGTQGETGKGVN